jgi:hypothetical protein
MSNYQRIRDGRNRTSEEKRTLDQAQRVLRVKKEDGSPSEIYTWYKRWKSDYLALKRDDTLKKKERKSEEAKRWAELRKKVVVTLGQRSTSPGLHGHGATGVAPAKKKGDVAARDWRDRRIDELEATVRAQQATIAPLAARVRELEAQLSQRSASASHPPSSEHRGAPSPARPKQTRRKGGAPSGHERKSRGRVPPR